MSQSKSQNQNEMDVHQTCCRVLNDEIKEKINEHRCCKLPAHNWMADVANPATHKTDLVEVRFKNGRKEFFRNIDQLNLLDGELVAVEASPGHDIGIVSLTGPVVKRQMKRKGVAWDAPNLKKIYRHARPSDLEKWVEAIEQEKPTLSQSRYIIDHLGIQMKLNDVEFQGDKTKAVFYYTAEDRVDFRILIKKLAEAFRIRIEMRQIGMRQEAGKLGGIGSCGRELCCASWMSSFNSVSTHSARLQQISLNPQKLAGQCSKLKCCLNYELDTYTEALKKFPADKQVIQTKEGEAIQQKKDLLAGIIWFSYLHEPQGFFAIPVNKVTELVALNKKGIIPDNLEGFVSKSSKTTDLLVSNTYQNDH